MAAYVSLEDAKTMGEKVLDEGYSAFIEAISFEPNLCNKIRRLGKTMIPPKPFIVWKKKGFGVAGTAYPTLGKIEMNTNYLNSVDAMRFIRNTMLHELAHIINGYYGGRNHDKQWKYIARLIGDDGERCHDYRRPDNAPIRKIHQLVCCDCGRVFNVSTYKYNRYTQYRCPCHGNLKKN